MTQLPARAIAAVVLLSGLGALLGVACSDSGSAGTQTASGTASGASSQKAAPTTTVEKSGDDDVRPLFPIDNSPPDPVAQQFCQAIYDLPATRTGDCCGSPGDKGRFTGECTRTLSATLRSKATTIDAAAVTACADAFKKDLEGCGWVGPSPPVLPEVCNGLIQGQLDERVVCRSSLECKGSLTCQGLTATRAGRCAPPKPAGIACGGAIDTLAALTRQNRTEREHPECAGYCARQCREAVAIGGACKFDDECGPKNHCLSGKCSTDPFPGAGKPCAGGQCAAGLRCVKDQCIAAKGEGEACESDLECRGGCEKAEGAQAGKCGKRCVVTKIPTGPPVWSANPAPQATPPRP